MTDFTNEFQRESRRIDQLIWDAMSLVAGERVLFCGFANDGQWVKRAVEVGVDVSVIESDTEKLAELQALNIPTLRGSTTLIPARDESFDAIVAFHYLHEIDPTFHTQIVWELARVGKRIIIVEPAPPADQLGKRIFELYSRAKYEAGAFEEYKPIDYWRKLLAMVKADVLMQQFTFTRLAPRFAVEETVNLMLSAMEVEAMPEAYLDELREIARGPQAQLSPLSRFVLVALAAGEPVRASAGTLFREDTPFEPVLTPAAPPPAPPLPGVTLTPVPPPPAYAAALQGSEFPPVLPPAGATPPPNPFAPQPFVPQQIQPAAAAPPQQPAMPQPPQQQPQPFAPAAAAAPPPQQQPAPFAPAPPQPAQPAFAPQLPPQAPPPPAFGMPPAAPESPFGVPTSEPAFGMPDPAPFGAPPPGRPTPFGTPFALADDPDPFGLSDDPEERAAFGWNWEPPEGTDSAQPGDVPFGR